MNDEAIAVGGNSFGGIETVLGAERVSYCAAADGAGAAVHRLFQYGNKVTVSLAEPSAELTSSW
jgi:hypothetical protein